MRAQKWLWPVICLSCFFLFHRPGLLTQSLSIEELLTSNLSHLGWEKFFGFLKQDTQLPLFYILQKLWGTLPLPDNDYFLKLPSVIYTALAMALGLRFIEKRSANNNLAMLVYSILFLFSPLIIASSLYARPYALLFLGCLWLTVKICESQGKFQELFTPETCFIGFLVLFSHALGLFFFISSFASWYIVFRPRLNPQVFSRKSFQILFGELIFALALMLSKWPSVQLISWTNQSEIYNPTNTLSAIFSLPAWISVVAVLALTWRKWPKTSWFLLISILIQLGIFVVFSLSSSLYVPRYWIVFMPLLLLLVNDSILQIKNPKWMVLLLVLIVSQQVVNPQPSFYGYKQAFTHLRAQVQLGTEETWACVTNDDTPHFLPNIYMRMYWGRELCSESLGMKQFIESGRAHSSQYVFIDKESISPARMQQYKATFPEVISLYSDVVFNLEK